MSVLRCHETLPFSKWGGCSLSSPRRCSGDPNAGNLLPLPALGKRIDSVLHCFTQLNFGNRPTDRPVSERVVWTRLTALGYSRGVTDSGGNSPYSQAFRRRGWRRFGHRIRRRLGSSKPTASFSTLPRFGSGLSGKLSRDVRTRGSVRGRDGLCSTVFGCERSSSRNWYRSCPRLQRFRRLSASQ